MARIVIYGANENTRRSVEDRLKADGLDPQVELRGYDSVPAQFSGFPPGSPVVGAVALTDFNNHAGQERLEKGLGQRPLLRIEGTALSRHAARIAEFVRTMNALTRAPAPDSEKKKTEGASSATGGSLYSPDQWLPTIEANPWFTVADRGRVWDTLDITAGLPAFALKARSLLQAKAAEKALHDALRCPLPEYFVQRAKESRDYIEAGGFKGKVPHHRWRTEGIAQMLTTLGKCGERGFSPFGEDNWMEGKALGLIGKAIWGFEIAGDVLGEWRRGLADDNPFKGSRARFKVARAKAALTSEAPSPAGATPAATVALSVADLGGPVAVEVPATHCGHGVSLLNVCDKCQRNPSQPETVKMPPLVFDDKPAREISSRLAKPENAEIEALHARISELDDVIEELRGRLRSQGEALERLTAEINSLNNIKTAAKMLLQEVMS